MSKTSVASVNTDVHSREFKELVQKELKVDLEKIMEPKEPLNQPPRDIGSRCQNKSKN